MRSVLLFLYTIILSFNIDAQQNQNPCSAPESKQFDFWIGSWNLEWKDQKGELQRGTNSIQKILDACVIEENFIAGGTTPFKGKSLSVFNTATGKWHQTWADNQGGYLDFTGEFSDGKMILSRSFTAKNGKKISQRMVYYNISEDFFNWNWESSSDEGKTWTINWQIDYKRKS